MCNPTSENNSQTDRSSFWQEEAMRQNQLYPDLSRLLENIFPSENQRSDPKNDPIHEQSVWENILAMFAGRMPPENAPNPNNQGPVPTAPPPENNDQVNGSGNQPPRADAATQREQQSSSVPSSNTGHGNQQGSGYNQNQSWPWSYGQNENNCGCHQHCNRRSSEGRQWSNQNRGYPNMFHYIPNEWAFSRSRSCAPMFLSVFFARLFQASIKATAMISLICFFLCVPHTLMAIGLAIAVIHSITRVPVFHLIAGSLFLSSLLYLNSQLLTILCLWATIKCVFMGRPLTNRRYWRHMFQMN